MPEREKQISSGIVEAMNILAETRGLEFVEGLIAGISIGTAQSARAAEQPG